jgi:hypothetical protein
MSDDQGSKTGYTLKEYEAIQEQVRQLAMGQGRLSEMPFLVIVAFWAFLINETADVKAQPIPAMAWWISQS